MDLSRRLAGWLADPDGAPVTTFDDLLALLAEINALLVTPELYGRIAFELLADLAAQNTLYAEIRMNPLRPLQRGLPLYELVEAIHSAQTAAEAAFGIQSGLILGLNRNRGPDPAVAIVLQARGLPPGWVAGFDLSDLETGWPPRLFRDVFAEIRGTGWPVTVHAGELGGPEAVDEAIELLHARRIGHGLRAVEDPDVLRRIAERDVHLELCPGSNRRLGLIHRLADHPLRTYLEAGLSVSINTDDPTALGVSLAEELARDAAAFDLSVAELQRMMIEAAGHSFARRSERDQLVRRLERAFRRGSGPRRAVSDDGEDRRASITVPPPEAQKRLDSLLRITRAVTSEIEIGGVLRVVAEQTSRALNAERTTMFILDRESGELWSRVAEGLQTREIRLPPGGGLAGSVAATDRPLNVPDAYTDHRFDPQWDGKTGYRTRSVLAYPLRDGDGVVVGVVQVINRRDGVFDDRDEDMLSGIAAAASAALANAQHYEDMRRLTESALQTMAAMLDARDENTAGHTERAAKTAELIGRRLGLTPGELASLRVAAAVHDYGKLSVPEAVLDKPGTLTDAEMALVHGHVEAARQILDNFDFPEPLADVPRIACEHHERLDGSGYPRGAKGDEISMPGRVLAVADVFDAMTSKRSYRPALTIEETVAYLVEERGVSFDPAVVDTVVANLDELRAIRAQAERPQLRLPSRRDWRRRTRAPAR